MSDRYATGTGVGTRYVEAKQLVSALDYNLAHWAGGALHLDMRREPEIRIHGDETRVVRRYDWIVKDTKGRVKIVDPTAFRDNYRPAPKEDD